MRTIKGQRSRDTAPKSRRRTQNKILTSAPHKKSMTNSAEADPTTAQNLRPKRSGLRRPRKPLPSLEGHEEVPDSVSQRHDYATLLRQLHIRHKNQHRGQLWFKQLGLLRRAVRELLDVEVQSLKLRRGGLGGHGGSALQAEDVRRKFEKEAELKTKKEGLEEWIRESLVPECYVRFSALVADGDGSFANLGVVLVGVVAGVGGVVGLPRTDDDGKAAVQSDAGVGRWTGRLNTEVEDGEDAMNLDGEDFGTFVHRDHALDRSKLPERRPVLHGEQRNLSQEHEDQAEDAIKTKKHRLKTPAKIPASEPATRHLAYISSKTQKSKKAKGKKTKNAIDDLFSGFT